MLEFPNSNSTGLFLVSTTEELFPPKPNELHNICSKGVLILCAIGEIVNVSVDENILTDGKIDLAKFKPIAYDPANHNYVTLGDKVGKAFSDGFKLK